MKGAFYNWHVISDSRGIARSGWHVPSAAEFETLKFYLDPAATFLVNTAGGQMKEAGTDHWSAPNTGATNSSGFTGWGTGYRDVGGAYTGINETLVLWNSTEEADGACISILLHNTESFGTSEIPANMIYQDKWLGHSIRLLKDSTLLTDGETGHYIGNDGKIYHTICIGTQEWMSENLAETEFRDGSVIPVVSETGLWVFSEEPLMCYYNNIPDGTYSTVTELVAPTKILINNCDEGIYLRWWFNGWHYFNFQNGYDINTNVDHPDIQTTNYFSIISKIQRPTRIKNKFSYQITIEGIKSEDMPGFKGMLLSEHIEQYEQSAWREVELTRGDFTVREANQHGYELSFEITRDEIPVQSSVYQKTIRLYIGDTLCDLDDDEVIPINKQVNNIAELQDRQSDFTAEFKIRKTRAMRGLFELSGEVGATTTIPYQNLPCRLVQDNVEVITNGIMVLDKVDEQYYHVSIMSGNLNFFKAIESLKLTDLLLPDTDHTWDLATMAGTHTDADKHFVYPLCEPSDEGSMAPRTDDGDSVEMYGGWIWPFIKVKTIWAEIFANAGYIVTGGDILDSDIFNRLYLPIVSRTVSDTTKYLYSVYWGGSYTPTVNVILGFPGALLIKGDSMFQGGYYTAPYTATYKITVKIVRDILAGNPTLNLHQLPSTGIFPFIQTSQLAFEDTFEIEYSATAGEILYVVITPQTYYYYSIAVSEIKDAQIAFGSDVESRLYLPDMTQIDFIKIICNMFGLVPETIPRDRKIRFWNYSELYDNVPNARDWSAYLSEKDDEIEFKFGDYAQNNYLHYKESDDVLPDNGMGNMPVDDETLTEEKDIVELGISTCDEVRILDNVFPVDVSRINFNFWNDDKATYEANKTIDPRIVYVDNIRSVASPAYEKTLKLRNTEAPLAGGGATTDINSPLKASSLEISFSNLIVYYANISRMLTKTNMRRAKFNLPVYEVAGLKHNIPIYLRQYKAYFHVNRISNYVAGQLCTVELIRL